MRRLAKLSSVSFLAAALVVAGLCSLGFAAQDPVPVDPPVVKQSTAGDLISGLAAAKASQSTAQATRDVAFKALADAEASLAAQVQAVSNADVAIKAAVAALGPVIVDGVVYEPTADGGYRSFRPSPAETLVPPPKQGP
jgi:hypothetical protein